MISLWSVLASVLWFSLALVGLRLLRKNTSFLMRYGSGLLLLVVLLAVVRLLLPVDGRWTIVVPSRRLLVAFHDFLRMPLGPITPGTLLGWVWAAGAGITLLWQALRIRNDLAWARSLVAHRPLAVTLATARLGLDSTQVVASPSVASPCAMGLLRPRIYLPLAELTVDEWEWVLRHEAVHLQKRDIWAKLLFRLLQCVLWWNPILHWAQPDLDALLELRCDHTVLAKCNTTQRVEYTMALCRVAQLQVLGAAHAAPTSMVSFASKGPDTLVQRVKLALEGPPTRRHTALALCLVALFVTTFFVVFQPEESAPSHESGFTANTKNSYLVQIGPDEYEFWVDGAYRFSISKSAALEPPFCDMEVQTE